MKTCTVSGCSKPAQKRGMCTTHYERARWEQRRDGTCRRCGEPKPDGIGRKLCDRCLAEGPTDEQRAKRKEYERQYYEANRERILARAQEKYDADPDGYRERKKAEARKWALANPERSREKARRYWAKKKYGLTLEEADAILARGCAICGRKRGSVVGPRGNFKTDPDPRLCLDHDHTNGRVRDALCHGCNTGLGSFRDDPNLLRAAAAYVENHKKVAGGLS